MTRLSSVTPYSANPDPLSGYFAPEPSHALEPQPDAPLAPAESFDEHLQRARDGAAPDAVTSQEADPPITPGAPPPLGQGPEHAAPDEVSAHSAGSNEESPEDPRAADPESPDPARPSDTGAAGTTAGRSADEKEQDKEHQGAASAAAATAVCLASPVQAAEVEGHAEEAQEGLPVDDAPREASHRGKGVEKNQTMPGRSPEKEGRPGLKGDEAPIDAEAPSSSNNALSVIEPQVGMAPAAGTGEATGKRTDQEVAGVSATGAKEAEAVSAAIAMPAGPSPIEIASGPPAAATGVSPEPVQEAGTAQRRPSPRPGAKAATASRSVEETSSQPADPTGPAPSDEGPSENASLENAPEVNRPKVEIAADGRDSRHAPPPHAAGGPEPAGPRRVAGVEDAPAAGGRSAPDAVASEQMDRVRLVQRVARAFEAAADRGGPIRLRLHPPELGSLRIELTLKRDAISARLETETEAARSMILDNLPALRERLAEHNLRVERFEVDWAGQSAGGLPQQSGGHAAWHDGGGQNSPSSSAHRPAPGPAATSRPVARSGDASNFDVVI